MWTSRIIQTLCEPEGQELIFVKKNYTPETPGVGWTLSEQITTEF